MKKLIVILTFIAAVSSCGGEEEPVRISLPDDVKAYFLNFETGTKWVYFDTLLSAQNDTIELLSVTESDLTFYNVTYEGFTLLFDAKRTENFSLQSRAGDEITSVRIEPVDSGGGDVLFQYEVDDWGSYTTYNDSLTLYNNSLFLGTIKSSRKSDYLSEVVAARDTGILFYADSDTSKVNAYYQLMEIIKP